MRKVSFDVGNLKTHVVSRMKRAHALAAQHKKIQYGSAFALAVLAAPFAVNAMGGVGPIRDVLSDGGLVSSQASSELSQEDSGPSGAEGSASDASKSSVQVEAKSHSSSAESNDVNVKVNGQNVPVPESGTVHKEVSGNGSSTVLDVRIKSDGNQTKYTSKSSTTVKIEQHSSSSGDVTQEGGSSRHPDRR